MKTQDEILKSMLAMLPNDYDKSEGGLFFDTLAPISHELDKVYQYLEMRFKNTFPETAQGEYLDLITREIDIHRKQATYSIGLVKITGNNGVLIPIGTKISSDSFLFETTEEKTIVDGQVIVPARSVEKGEIYNVPAGAIKNFPITIQGLNSVTNEAPFVDGFDTESDKSLLERYLLKIREPQTSGNIYDYKKWALDVEGVGNVKVFPLWNGNGTVKVLIIGNDNLPANTELKNRVQNYINEHRPIGANVTVESAEALNINISVSIRKSILISEEEIRESIKSSLLDFVKNTAFKENFISLAKVGYNILKNEVVLDYKDLSVNGQTQNNITISETRIAVLNELIINFYEE